MTDFEDRAVVERLKRLSQIEPGRESTRLALEHARAALVNLPAATASQTLETVKRWDRIAHWMGARTTKQRIAALGGVGVAALLGVLLLWGWIDTQSVSAMEKMAENVRRAKSYKCTHVVRFNSDSEGVHGSTTTVLWLAHEGKDGSYSKRSDGAPFSWPGPGPLGTQIFPAGVPGITINHRTKTFRRFSSNNPFPSSSVDDLENLGRFSGKANRDLGTKEINGKKARGFEIDSTKIDPAFPIPTTLEVWLDTKTDLPVRVRYSMKDRCHTTFEITDIAWNIELDRRLFDLTPPQGYKDDTPNAPASEKQIRQITEALKGFAELMDGHYSQTNAGVIEFGNLSRAYPAATTQTKHGETGAKIGSDRKPDILSQKVGTTLNGFELLQDIHNYNPDAAYYGKTVGPKDKDKILLRWKLDDGRYEVIYGDLRNETVTAERLRALEGK